MHSENITKILSDRFTSVPEADAFAKHALQMTEGSLKDMLSISNLILFYILRNLMVNPR